MRKRRKIPETDTGMFADVSFQLLIFFMVVTTFNKSHRLEMILPPIIENPIPGQIAKDKLLKIMLNNNGEYSVNESIYKNAEDLPLIEELERITTTNKKGVIKIDMTPEVPYARYLDLIAQIKTELIQLKENKAIKFYNRSYSELNDQQKQIIESKSKISISEKEVIL